MSVDKLVRDGKVAVLVSPGFGAGWSTWCNSENQERAAFDPILATIVIGEDDRDLEAYLEEAYPGEYYGGIRGLQVEWLPVGTRFAIHEYDGSETILMSDYLKYEA